MSITSMAQDRLNTEVEPILEDRRRGLQRYTDALNVIDSIHADIDAAGCWYNPLTWLDQANAYGLLTAKAKFIGDVCQAITTRLLAS